MALYKFTYLLRTIQPQTHKFKIRKKINQFCLAQSEFNSNTSVVVLSEAYVFFNLNLHFETVS